MLKLSNKWAPKLINKPETGMGYQIATIILKTGMQYKQAVIEEGFITKIRYFNDIPFEEADIADIIITHDKWDW